MAQHDMNIANQGFPATRADLNNALQALVTNSSGTSAPTTTFSNQWWFDETNNKMYLRNEANNAWVELFTMNNDEWELTTGVVQAKDADGLAFETDDGTTRFAVEDSGNVTINEGGFSVDFRVESDTSTHALFVDGSANKTFIGKSATGLTTAGHEFGHDGYLYHIRNGNIMWLNQLASTGNAITFMQNSGTVGAVAVASTGTTYSTTSDLRLKTDIEPITDSTEKLMAMKPVCHKWKADPDADAVHGFIAQEMQDIAPEAVTGDPNSDEMMSMDYGRITPLIVAALQEANAKIEVLEKRIQELENN